MLITIYVRTCLSELGKMEVLSCRLLLYYSQYSVVFVSFDIQVDYSFYPLPTVLIFWCVTNADCRLAGKRGNTVVR